MMQGRSKRWHDILKKATCVATSVALVTSMSGASAYAQEADATGIDMGEAVSVLQETLQESFSDADDVGADADVDTESDDASDVEVSLAEVADDEGALEAAEEEVQDISVLGTNAVEATVNIAWYTAKPTAKSYTIKNGAQLRGLAALVNGTAVDSDGNAIAAQSFEGVTFTQGADFSLYEYDASVNTSLPAEFTPIGTSEHPFAGTYNGNDKTIEGLYITSTYEYAGLFGVTSSESCLKNITIQSGDDAPSQINLATSTQVVSHVGSLVGRAGGSVDNCKSYASVKVASTLAATSANPYVVRFIGGLIGSCMSNVTSCSFAGSVDVGATTTPVATTKDSDNIYVADCIGGVVGRFGDPEVYGTLSDCKNTATVWVHTSGEAGADRFSVTTYASSNFVAGVCGYSNGNVKNCTNGDFNELKDSASGLVSTSALDSATGSVLDNRGADHAAGIVGGLRATSDDPDRYNDGSADHPVYVQNCWNVGKIIGRSCCGGVVGESGSYTTIEQCRNGIPSEEIPGHVICTRWNKPITGGIVGRVRSGKIIYCANYGVVENVQTGYYTAGVCGALWSSDDTDASAVTSEMYGCINTGNIYTSNRSNTAEYREAGLLGTNEGYIHDCIMLKGTVPYHSDAAIGASDWGMYSNLYVMTQEEMQTSSSAAILNSQASTAGDWGCYWFVNSSGYPVLNIWASDVDRVALSADMIASSEQVSPAPYVGQGSASTPIVSVTLTDGTVLVQNADFYLVAQDGAYEMSGDTLAYKATLVGIGRYSGTVVECIPYSIGKADLSQASVVVSEGTYGFGKVSFPTSVAATIAGFEVSPSEYDYVIYDSGISDASSTDAHPVFDSAGYVSFDEGATLLAVSSEDVNLNAETRGYVLYDRDQQKISDSAGNVYYTQNSGGVVGSVVANRTSCINLKSGTPAGYLVELSAKSGSYSLSGTATGHYVIKTISLYTDCTVDAVYCQGQTWSLDRETSIMTVVGADGNTAGATPTATFTGESIIPTATITYGDYTLEQGKDYWIVGGDPDPSTVGQENISNSTEVSDSLNRNVTSSTNRAAITIRPVDTTNLTNYYISYFEIAPAKLEDCTVSIQADEWAYTGSAVEPEVTVKLGDVVLQKDVDYTVSYSNNTVKGQATYTVTALANLSGGNTQSVSGTFQISDGYDLSDFTLSKIADQQYNFGYDVHPDLVFNGKDGKAVNLTEGVDYKTSYSTTYVTKSTTVTGQTPCTVTVTGIGKYTGQLTGSFDIVPYDATTNKTSQLVVHTQELTYGAWSAGNGAAAVGVSCPVVNVLAYPIVDWSTMTKGDPIVISASTSTKYGRIQSCKYYDADGNEVKATTALPGSLTAKVTLVCGSTVEKSGAIGTLEAQVEYGDGTSLSNTDAVKWSVEGNRSYTGSEITPIVGTAASGVALVEGIDYTIEYFNNVKAGEASYRVTAVEGSKFSGSYEGVFTILAVSVSGATVSSIDDQVYKGEALTPQPVVTVGGRTLVAGEDYTLAYSQNNAVGTARVTITGTGNYSGSKTVTFEIIKVKTTEVGGNTRFETAVKASQMAYPDGSNAVIVAYAYNFPDALAASSLAGAMDCPILITGNSGDVNSTLIPEIKRLKGSRSSFQIIIVGGKSVVTEATKNQLAAISGCNVERLATENGTRYTTQMEIYKYGKTHGYWQGDPIVVTATGYADALSISSYAAKYKCPIFLTNPTSGLNSDAKKVLKSDYSGCKRVLIIGGTSVVSSGDESWLKANVTSNVVRKSGKTRYDTSAAVAQFCIDEGMSADVCAVATGQDYVDALVAGPMQAKANGPIVLVAANTNKGYKYASGGLNFTAFQNVLNNGSPEEIRFMGGHLETSPVPQSSRDKMVAMIN